MAFQEFKPIDPSQFEEMVTVATHDLLPTAGVQGILYLVKQDVGNNPAMYIWDGVGYVTASSSASGGGSTIGAVIDDNAISTTTGWSSNEVSSRLGTKANSSSLAGKADKATVDAALLDKSDKGHKHMAADVTDLTATVDSRINTQKGAPNGIAGLENGKIPTALLGDLTPKGSVPTFADLQALPLVDGDRRIVLNSTGDGVTPVNPSGKPSWADYICDGITWIKLKDHTEADSLSITWGDVANKPTSPIADIDATVGAKHSHTNKSTLDRLGISGTQVTVDGQTPPTAATIQDIGTSATKTYSSQKAQSALDTKADKTDSRFHAHANATPLSKVNEAAGKMTYGGAVVETRVFGVATYAALPIVANAVDQAIYIVDNDEVQGKTKTMYQFKGGGYVLLNGGGSGGGTGANVTQVSKMGITGAAVGTPNVTTVSIPYQTTFKGISVQGKKFVSALTNQAVTQNTFDNADSTSFVADPYLDFSTGKMQLQRTYTNAMTSEVSSAGLTSWSQDISLSEFKTILGMEVA